MFAYLLFTRPQIEKHVFAWIFGASDQERFSESFRWAIWRATAGRFIAKYAIFTLAFLISFVSLLGAGTYHLLVYMTFAPWVVFALLYHLKFYDLTDEEVFQLAERYGDRREALVLLCLRQALREGRIIASRGGKDIPRHFWEPPNSILFLVKAVRPYEIGFSWRTELRHPGFYWLDRIPWHGLEFRVVEGEKPQSSETVEVARVVSRESKQKIDLVKSVGTALAPLPEDIAPVNRVSKETPVADLNEEKHAVDPTVSIQTIVETSETPWDCESREIKIGDKENSPTRCKISEEELFDLCEELVTLIQEIQNTPNCPAVASFPTNWNRMRPLPAKPARFLDCATRPEVIEVSRRVLEYRYERNVNADLLSAIMCFMVRRVETNPDLMVRGGGNKMSARKKFAYSLFDKIRNRLGPDAECLEFPEGSRLRKILGGDGDVLSEGFTRFQEERLQRTKDLPAGDS